MYRSILMRDAKELTKTIVRLGLSSTGLMYIGNKVIFSLSSGKNLLKPGNGRYFRWKYGDIYYQKTGTGSPLVLLHDLNPSCSAYVWNEVIDTLSEKHTVYAVDLPGCGRSAKPKLTYTNYFYVLFLRAFIKSVVRRKTDVIADGYSSSIALMTAMLDQALIGHISAINPSSLKELSQTETRRSRAAGSFLSTPIFGTTIYNMDHSRQRIDYSFTENYLYNPFRSKDRFVDAFYESAHYNEGKGRYLLASVKGLSMTVDIHRAVHVLGDRLSVFYGEGTENGKYIASTYKSLNKNVDVHEIPSTRYLPMMERPHDFLKVLLNADVI